MIGIRFWTRRNAGGVVLFYGLSALVTPTAAWAQAFPANDAAWLTLTRTDPVTKVTAPIIDPAGDAPGPRDMVGNANHPAAYVQSDATHQYFRLRINQNARQNASTFRPYGWGCVIDTDGDASDYELMAILDGVSNPDSVNLRRNTVQAIPDDPVDAPEATLRAYIAPLVLGQPGYGYAREVTAGAHFPSANPDADFFVDWAIERSALLEAGVGPHTPIRIACGTSSMGDVLSTDLPGPPNLPILFGDFVVCGDDGCIAQNCSDFGTDCSAGIGGCANAGTVVCDAMGQPVCNAVAGTPSAEICNGIDDNCDGTTDEGNLSSGTDCTSGLPGKCEAGKTVCAGGALLCLPEFAVGEFAEICNGEDDDCDGVPDDGLPGGGNPCTTGFMGACATGFTTCGGGVVTCAPVAMPGAQAETCNGVDDNCDGVTDEGFTLGATCVVGLGACEAAGVLVCDAGGGASCSAAAGLPGTEVCGDAIDSDCDGEVDSVVCPDEDLDGLPDHVEEDENVGSDPKDADTDDDGVRDGLELSFDKDTDGDGVINVLDPDSDDDGLFDGTEMGLDCSDPSTNQEAGHCIPDADKGVTTTDPLDGDTDDGTVSDGDEDTDKDGVVDPGERDPLVASDDVISTTPPCEGDASCKDGQICVDGVCMEGCRGTEGGPGCPDGEQCTSTGAEAGECVPAAAAAPDDDIYLGGGCACTTGSTKNTKGRLIGALAALGALALRRKRR